MAYRNIQMDPTPGPQQPKNYPFVGPNYQRYGEQPGFYYDPYKDSYVRADDPGNPANKPKENSLSDIIIPVAAVGGASVLAQEGGKALVPAIKDLIPSAAGIKGMFGLGGGAATPVTGVAATPALAAPQVLSATAVPGAVPATAANLAAPQIVSATAPAASQGMFSLGGIGSAGNAILPAAGALGAYDLINHAGDYSEGRSALQGAASGAAIGSYFGGPVVGGGIGALVGLGISLFGGDKDKWKTEGNRLRKLQDDGVYVPGNLLALGQTKGHKTADLIKKELPKDFIGMDPKTGLAVNNKFASSRNVKDLTPGDISLYSAWAEQMPDWYQKSQDERLQWAKAALQSGAVKEHHGTIDIDFSKFSGPVKEKVDQFELIQKQPPPTKESQGTATAVLQYKDPNQPGVGGMMGMNAGRR